MEASGNPRKAQPNLEDTGLLVIDYDGFTEPNQVSELAGREHAELGGARPGRAVPQRHRNAGPGGGRPVVRRTPGTTRSADHDDGKVTSSGISGPYGMVAGPDGALRSLFLGTVWLDSCRGNLTSVAVEVRSMWAGIRRISAVTLASLGAAGMVFSLLVMWSGRPVKDALDVEVIPYYTGHTAGIRFGSVVWMAGILALVASAVLVRSRMKRGAGWSYLAGMIVCGAILFFSGLVAFLVAGDAAAGNLSAEDALLRWQLQTSLYEGAAFLLGVPVLIAAIGLDRERRFGVVMTVLGVILAATVVRPVSPWTFFAMLGWIVAMTAFVAHTGHERVYAEHESFARTGRGGPTREAGPVASRDAEGRPDAA